MISPEIRIIKPEIFLQQPAGQFQSQNVAFQPPPAPATISKPSAFPPSNQFPCSFTSNSPPGPSPYFEAQFEGDPVQPLASPQVITPENNKPAENLFQNTGEISIFLSFFFDVYF